MGRTAWTASVIIVLGLLWLSSTAALGGIHTEEVAYTRGDTTLKGYLAYQDGTKTKRPGVLVVHEWWGLNQHARNKAEALAEEGFIALAVDMYGGGRRTEHPEEAKAWSNAVRSDATLRRARFKAAYDLLKAHPLAEGDRIAAIGYCFGGFIVLSAALEGEPLKAVVSFHGALPEIEPPPGGVEAAVMVCHGADDPLVTFPQIQAFNDTLRRAGADWQFIFYGGAKHSFTNPEADTRNIPALAYDRKADMRSWNDMLGLLREVLLAPTRP